MHRLGETHAVQPLITRGLSFHGIAIAVVLTASLAMTAGCSNDDSSRVCGVIDRATLEAMIGTSDYTVTGDLTKEKQLFGSSCQVFDGYNTVLITNYVPVLGTADHAKLKSGLLESRNYMASRCPDLRKISGLAFGNACVKDDAVDLIALTRTVQIQLKLESSIKTVTFKQAEVIAREIAAGVPDKSSTG